MAELRLLQNGGVHLLHGESDFKRWAERTFDGIGGVWQLTRCGEVLLQLEQAGRIDLANPKGVGTSGLRELSNVLNSYGVKRMVEVYDNARRVQDMTEPDADVLQRHVESALTLLLPPPTVSLNEPPALLDEEETTDEEIITSVLVERVHRIHDLLFEISEDDDKTTAYTEAMAEMRRLGAELKGETTDDEEWIDSSR
jgi:hypothetical protein